MTLEALFVMFVVISFYLIITKVTKKNLIDNKNSDAFLQLQAAERFGEWILPSKMHIFSRGKTYMKDMGLLMLVFVVKVLRFPHKFSAIIQVCILSHLASAILLFLIADSLFDSKLAMLVFFFYLSCAWAYQIILIGGYQLVAQLVFLVLFYMALELPEVVGLFPSSVMSGLLFGSLIFSSASARKYYIPAVSSFVFAYYNFKGENFLSDLRGFFLLEKNWVIGGVVLGVIVFYVFLWLIKKKVVEYKENGLTIPLVGKTFNPEYETKYYLDIYKSCAGALAQFFYLFLPLWSLALLKSGSEFPVYFLMFLIGATGAVLFFSYPNFFKIIREGFGYLSNVDAGHFMLYRDYFEKVDGPIKSGWRAKKSGVGWILRISLQYVPFQTLLYFVLFFLALFYADSKLEVLLVLIVSLSPHVWGELTHGPQIGRSYFPGYTGMLLGIPFYYSFLPWWIQDKYFSVLCSICLLSVIYGAWTFLFDIFKTKMWVTNLKLELNKLGISEFSTYKSDYNNSFVEVLEMEFPGEFLVQYVDKIKNSKYDFFVVPCTSSKAAHMESEKEALENGDYNQDETLERLLATDEIESFSLARIETIGNSRFWVHESEVTSYRYLMLQEYDEVHFKRSFAWVLNVKNLKSSGR